LVVEDDVLTGLALKEHLEDGGATVAAHHDAESAMLQLARTEFDAAIIDIALPGMHGDIFADECRRRWPGMAIVLATGHSEHDVRKLFPSDARVEIVEKPYEFQVILDGLARLGVFI
jgi:DNA-binding NtrC family response regulator